MRWYGLLSLLSDGRVEFLLWFVVAALVVAGVLTLIEFQLKKKKIKHAAVNVEDTVIDKMKKFLKRDKTPMEKLEYVDKTSKKYFHETYGTPSNAGYSVLVQDFEKNKRKSEVDFCRAMFATYYSRTELTDDQVSSLAKLLFDIEKKKKKAEEISRVPSFSEKIIRFFDLRMENSLIKKEIAAEKKRSSKIRKKRFSDEGSDLSIVRKMEGIARDRRKVEERVLKKQAVENNKKKVKIDREIARENRVQEDIMQKQLRDKERDDLISKKIAMKKGAIVAKEELAHVKNKMKAEKIVAKALIIETKRKLIEKEVKRKIISMKAENRARAKEIGGAKVERDNMRLKGREVFEDKRKLRHFFRKKEESEEKKQAKIESRQKIFELKAIAKENIRSALVSKKKRAKDLKIARAKILSDKIDLEKNSILREKKAKAESKFIAKQEVLQVKELRRRQAREKKAEEKAVAQIRKLDEIEAKRIVRERIRQDRELRENQIRERNVAEKVAEERRKAEMIKSNRILDEIDKAARESSFKEKQRKVSTRVAAGRQKFKSKNMLDEVDRVIRESEAKEKKRISALDKERELFEKSLLREQLLAEKVETQKVKKELVINQEKIVKDNSLAEETKLREARKEEVSMKKEKKVAATKAIAAGIDEKRRLRAEARQDILVAKRMAKGKLVADKLAKAEKKRAEKIVLQQKKELLKKQIKEAKLLELNARNKIVLAKKKMVEDAMMKSEISERERAVKMRTLENSRNAEVAAYSIGSTEWMRELKRNSR